jgi:AraC-like DNA-binding protein
MMQYQLANPSYSLTSVVKQYWTMESVVSDTVAHMHRIVPTGLNELIFYFGDVPTATQHSKEIEGSTAVSGHIKGFYDLQIKGRLSLFSVLFQPYAFTLLFDVPPSAIYNHTVSLYDLIPEHAAQIEDGLFEAATFYDRVALIEQFLVARLSQRKQHDHFKRIFESIQKINFQKGMIDIDFLAAEACFSRKQFERVFTQLIGTTPKQFLKTVRFQNALLQRNLNPNWNMTTLSHAAGYYDQSHMNNDFLKLSGVTPKQYFDDCDPVSDYFG